MTEAFSTSPMSAERPYFRQGAEECREGNSAACQTAPLLPDGLPRARRTDPVSSHLAAGNADKFASTHAGRILAALTELRTANAAEIAAESGLTVVQVDRRRKELETAGLVYMLRQDGKLFLRDGFMVWSRSPA